MEKRATEDIPADAAELFSKNETFRRFRANLDLTVAWYNKVRTTILEVEYPLIDQQLKDIDAQLEQAEKSLNWTNDSKYAFICVTLSGDIFTFFQYKANEINIFILFI